MERGRGAGAASHRLPHQNDTLLSIRLTLTAPEYACINHIDQRDFFNLKSSQTSSLALSALFEYLCYGSIAIINVLILLVRGSPYTSE